eukprot:CAMPEP_0172761554 /NCGR_PEP_ID=MMETSP1074-20121228/171779_1 /TAXON_ID=2916 /ORGANISM="Ceratium fusus, Strain PA161109" /LENGTH=64 /DNA_ID=CAMNT_0013595785 /DNA_START=948 /DNA_END=1140 /DNA_ORIENTATION=+
MMADALVQSLDHRCAHMLRARGCGGVCGNEAKLAAAEAPAAVTDMGCAEFCQPKKLVGAALCWP